VQKTTDVVKEGDKVKVKLLGFDERGKVRLSMKVVDQTTGEDLEAKQKAEPARGKLAGAEITCYRCGFRNTSWKGAPRGALFYSGKMSKNQGLIEKFRNRYFCGWRTHHGLGSENLCC